VRVATFPYDNDCSLLCREKIIINTLTRFYIKSAMLLRNLLFVAMLAACLLPVVAAAVAARANKGRQRGSPYNFGLSYRVTDLVNMTLSINNQHTAHIGIGLFGKTAPKAVENFKALCTMRDGFGYVNSTFHRVLRDFIVQGGDFEHHNGKGGYSVFNDNPGRRFSAENYNCPHKQGSLAMASESRTRLGSQFYFVAGKEDDVRFLNGKHVVFGHAVSGLKTVLKMGRVPTSRDDVPKHTIRITACTTSLYVDPQDKLTEAPKKLLLDDDEFGTPKIGGKVFEGPKKRAVPAQKGAADAKQKGDQKKPGDGAPAGKHHKADAKQKPETKPKADAPK
jgi:peptidyl-prolyl cis-trans isomerase B (cyclophilin B)